MARQGQQWAESDAKDTKRIVERVWQLVRAGRSSEARDMCRSCGQSWRAASLGEGPGAGPTNLGAAAQQVHHGESSLMGVISTKTLALLSQLLNLQLPFLVHSSQVCQCGMHIVPCACILLQSSSLISPD